MRPVEVGTVQSAICACVVQGAVLHTPARRSPFTVDVVDGDGVVLLFGAQETPTRISWSALEGVREYLEGRGWIEIGSRYTVDAKDGTLDAYLKQHISRATAGWVAALLEAAGVVQVDRGRPIRVRLSKEKS